MEGGEKKGHIIRERYEATAGGYDSLYRAEQFEKYFVALRKFPPRGKVLDAGCGTGLLIEFLGVQGLTSNVDLYVCLDYSWEMVWRATSRRRVFLDGRGLQVMGNVLHLPFQDKTFDIVYSFTVLDLVDDLEMALTELLRVSRGPVIVSLLKTLPYKDVLIRKGARLIGSTSKDVIFRVD